MADRTADLVRGPLFFERNRVYRVYRGGKLFHDFFGDPPEDGFHPEEWVASAVRALNKEPKGEHEGVSIVAGTGIPFTRLIEQHRKELVGPRPGLELLVKMLDSAIRLPVQAHPDKAYSRKHFNSNHGKTESWIVVATRPDAKVFFGFRDGVTRDDLVKGIAASETDRSALPALLNQLPARPGDLYMIPARVAHAIGAGCLILEVQEPTDFTIQPEAWCGDYHLTPFEMYLGQDAETALECFDFTLTGERALAAGRKTPEVTRDAGGVRSERLIGPRDTTDFSVNRHRVTKGRFALAAGPAIYVVTEGKGKLVSRGGARPLGRGSYFFVPAACSDAEMESDGALEAVECLPPYPA
jgi:mannose-6-phosphate isomerase